MDKIKVKNIFAAVADKSVLDPLLEILDPKSVKFWGTEGTIEYVKVKGYSGKSVVSGFDFDGKVKSLGRLTFARILADRAKKSHSRELKNVILSEAKNLKTGDPSPSVQDDAEPFDLVVVDLYRSDKNNFPESMDIGGQALIRAAIKNYKNVALAFDAGSIKELVEELNSKRGWSSFRFRKAQAKKAAKFIAERTQIEGDFFNEL